MTCLKSIALCSAVIMTIDIGSISSMALANDPSSINDEGDAYSHELLKEDMDDMDDSIRKLLYLTHEGTRVSDKWLELIIKELDTLQRIADYLKYENYSTSSLIPNKYLENFISDVELAQEQVSENPPNLEPTLQLINSCRNCHDKL